MRTIGVITAGRSDFGIYLPILKAIQTAPDLELHLIATGGHLSPTFGWTVEEISAHGFEVRDQVDMLLSSDAPVGIAKSMGLGILGMAQVFQQRDLDIILTLGDRFDMLAAALAAIPFKIPIAHVHGGEVTSGAIDDVFRHTLTKCSHLHFAATDEHARRIVQLGEEPWRVTVAGAPALDNLTEMEWMSLEELEGYIGIDLRPAPLLVTYHPVTLQYEQTDAQIQSLIAALSEIDGPIIITKPNADTSGQTIIQRIEEFASKRPNICVFDNLGTHAYFNLMKIAAAMVGNSSSGIIEAASFKLPVVNIGIRQQGRPRSHNVIDVGNKTEQISAGLQTALSQNFRDNLQYVQNIYGKGNAGATIVQRLQSISLDESFTLKQFYDFPIAWDQVSAAA